MTQRKQGRSYKKAPKKAIVGDLDVAAIIRQAASERVAGFLESDFAGQIQEIASEEARRQIRSVLEKRIAGEVPPYLEGLTFTPTNTWGEKKGEPETLREHVQRVVRTWLDEPMNYQGKTKKEDTYNWRADTTRGAWLVGEHIQYAMKAAIDTVMKDAKAQLGKSLEDAFKLKLTEFMQTFTLGGKQ